MTDLKYLEDAYNVDYSKVLYSKNITQLWDNELGDKWKYPPEFRKNDNKISYPRFVPIDLRLAVIIAKEAGTRVQRRAGASCTLTAQTVHGAFLEWMNLRRGGRFAEGMIGANKVNFHASNHMLNWVITPENEIWLLDAGYSGNVQMSRWVYQVSETDRGFFGLKM